MKYTHSISKIIALFAAKKTKNTLNKKILNKLLAQTDDESFQWRKNFIATFLERDLRRLGVMVAPE